MATSGRPPEESTVVIQVETQCSFESGSVGTVDLTQAEFRILQEMIDSGELSGTARTMFDGMRKAYNAGLSADSELKLLDLYSSRRSP
jgi:hypothetical protein